MSSIEVTNAAEIAAKLRLVGPTVKKNFQKRSAVVSTDVVAKARARASWSRTIPAAIVPFVATTGVGVRVESRVPIAVLNERPGGWSHPVFGRGSVRQPSRPSVRPTVEESRPRVIAAGEAAVSDAVKELRF